MAGRPLQGAIGKDQVVWPRVRPGANLEFGELNLGQPRTSEFQCVFRQVDPDDLRLRKTARQQRRGVSGSATEIDHFAGPGAWDAVQEIDSRERPLLLKDKVANRGPRNIPHGSSSGAFFYQRVDLARKYR